MVYCGKPSAGCLECRKRKTRCDKDTPSCGQCVRADRTCSGYRNKLDLMFRSENAVVVGKAKSRGSSTKSHSKPSLPEPASVEPVSSEEPINAVVLRNDQNNDRNRLVPEHEGSSSEYQVYSEPTPLLASLTPTLDERAKGYFATNSPKWLRNHDLVDNLCKGGDEPLLASISAVGMASYANSIPGPHLYRQARLDYVKALRLTNEALRSPTEVGKDSTLASVFILSIFEMVAGSNEHSLEAWTEHIIGASALLKIRGPSQFRTKAGQQLFMMITSNLMVSCVQRTVPIPEHIIELRKIASKLMHPSVGPAWNVSSIVFDFATYRAAVRDCEIVGPKAIIEAGLEIDRKFVKAFENIPDSWLYHTIHIDHDDENVWNRRYDVYDDYWAAQIWNGMRTCRILINEIIRDQLLNASTALTPIFTEEEVKEQNAQSVHALLTMQADILATIPMHLPSSTYDMPQSLMEGTKGYFILWPLYMTGVMDLATQPIKTWVIGRLRAVAAHMGIGQATVLADIMQSARHVRIWDTKISPRLKKGQLIGRCTPSTYAGSFRPDWWNVVPIEENLEKELEEVPMSWE